MAAKKILYISGSLGLGHITRDLAIAERLRKQNPAVEITWLAAHPATKTIEEAGEKLHPAAGQYANDNIPAENAAKGAQLNLIKYLTDASKEWSRNFEVLCNITSSEQIDLIIGDETYEILVGYKKNPRKKQVPFVMIYDFIGVDAMTQNPIEKLGAYVWNRIWSREFKLGKKPIFDLGLFIGEEEDVPDRSFGFFLPNRRDYARSLLKFVGYVFPFSPDDYKNKSKSRAKLGYGKEPLILCSIGGTSVGKELLNLCGKSYSIIKEKIPDVRMILVCGPRLASESLDVPIGVEVKEYIPALYEHFAVCDLAIVQGGGTTTLELTVLGRPFIYFPLEGHFEQVNISERLDRHRAGIRMVFSETTPQSLAEAAIQNLGKKVNYSDVPTDGAAKAAELINRLLL